MRVPKNSSLDDVFQVAASIAVCVVRQSIRTTSERKLYLYLSGHAVYRFDGVTYLFSRIRDRGKRGTIVYLYESGELLPYCEIPSGGDCSYSAAVRFGAEMFVSYYSSHEGSTNIYTCRVPLHDR